MLNGTVPGRCRRFLLLPALRLHGTSHHAAPGVRSLPPATAVMLHTAPDETAHLATGAVRHGDAPFRHGDAPFRHGDAPFRHGDAPSRHGDAPSRHGDMTIRHHVLLDPRLLSSGCQVVQADPCLPLLLPLLGLLPPGSRCLDLQSQLPHPCCGGLRLLFFSCLPVLPCPGLHVWSSLW